MRGILPGVLVGVVMLAGWGTALQAAEVPIPNGNFEADDASTQLEFAFPSPLTDWQGGSSSTTGCFYNYPGDPDFFITNLNSTQAGYLFNVPGAELHQVLPSTYQVGQAYHLQFGLIASDDTVPFVGAVPSGAPFEVQLYYLNNSSDITTVGADNVTNTGTAIVDQTVMDMFELDIPAVQAGDPWANQPIGIQLIVPTDESEALEGGEWDVGNLDLSEVPEPASLALLGCGLAALVSRRRAR